MALYRKYRPASFAEVLGQDHVTRPLSVALDSGRINHAYLFSGPRGCGKTSSARIMARSLNCIEGPTSTPCGVCPSCVALAPGGSGTLDVMELDAASHRGVDDMRELRDRAYYAPAESRYRVFIIDEAHMITGEGSNALLKIVEEPPEHVIFIFATTEPEKVIGTIRSRTHHYPFRLLTPPDMRTLLERVVASEGVRVEDSVYPLIIRAGGGSPRDSLSILDQLLSGVGDEGLTYDAAVPLLGVTSDALLDAALSALASAQPSAFFRVVEDVVTTGHDPRRFTSDLLDRLRDVMIVATVPDAFSSGLVNVPAERQSILQSQADSIPPAEIARLAAGVAEGLNTLRGATSPRLLLEVLGARLMAGRGNWGSAVPAAPISAAPVDAAATAEAPAEATECAHTEEEQIPEAPVYEEPDSSDVATPENAETIRATIAEQWPAITKTIAEKNQLTGILLAEARIVEVNPQDTGMELVLGHSTGALAERLRTKAHEDVITSAIAEHTGYVVTVRWVVGTHAHTETAAVPRVQQETVEPSYLNTVQVEAPIAPEPESVYDTAAEEEEMLAQAEEESGSLDHRTVEMSAIDLVQTELGGSLVE